MSDAHDALMCIGSKSYLNDKNREKLSKEHYLKNNDDMMELFSDLPEALINNYNLPQRCSFKPEYSKPMLPNIGLESGHTPNELLIIDAKKGLELKFRKNDFKNGKTLQKDMRFIRKD